MTSQKEGRKFLYCTAASSRPQEDSFQSRRWTQATEYAVFKSAWIQGNGASIFVLLETELKVSHMLGRHSTAEAHTQLSLLWKRGTTLSIPHGERDVHLCPVTKIAGDGVHARLLP